MAGDPRSSTQGRRSQPSPVMLSVMSPTNARFEHHGGGISLELFGERAPALGPVASPLPRRWHLVDVACQSGDPQPARWVWASRLQQLCAGSQSSKRSLASVDLIEESAVASHV